MKKGICFLGMIIAFMLCTISARADAIWVPPNDFLEKHLSDCKYVSRQFIANGPDGKVILYKSPESSKEVATWENGYKTWIIFTYEDARGIVWGFPSDKPGMSGQHEDSGWMPMEYMKVVYDSISFMEEHRDELEHRDGILNSINEGEVYFWEYPGSENKRSDGAYDYEYSSIYIDEEGHNWGFVLSNYDYRWICLDNPTAEFEELYPDGAPQVEVKDDEESQEGEIQDEERQTAENLNTERIKPQTNSKTAVVVTVMVGAVVLVTIVLLVMLKKRK